MYAERRLPVRILTVRRLPVKTRALLLPDQVVSAVCGKARVPSAVKERLLVTFMMQQQELQQEVKQQQYKLEQEIRERSQWQLAAKEAEHLVHNRTTELLVLKGCMNLRGVLEFVENEAKKFGAPN